MKRFVLFSMLFLAFFGLNALEVNQPELESVGKDTIEFINYTGPHTVINTKDEISGIGSALGEKVAPNVANNYATGDNNKYYVIHAVDSSVTTGLDADILILGKNANVDHIKNLRSIISSYLVSAYGYSKEDADTLAVFITVYNAVYRNDLDTYKSKYKEVVTKNLTKENCGISVNYKDWPGNTQLVIPLLNPVDGGLSTIDTTIISDSTVIESMQEEDERGVDERKNLVDIKEREADVAQEEAKEAQKQATVAKQEVTQAKEELKKVEEEKQIVEKELEEAKEELEKNPTDSRVQEAVKEAEKKVEEAEEKVEEAVAKVEEKVEEAEKKAEEAKEAQSFADKKLTEAQTERSEIATDQQKNIADAKAEEKMITTYGLQLVDNSNLLSKLVFLDVETGKIVKSSPVQVIRNRSIVSTGNGFAAIAGDTGENQAIRLVILDSENLEIVSQTEEDVAPNAVLVSADNYLYTVVKSTSGYVVAKYSNDLRLQAKSTLKVMETTPITVTDKGIVVTDSYGAVKLLSKSDLSTITSTETTSYSSAK